MAIAHSRFGASSSSRWINCPASITAEADKTNSSSAFAQEGTCAHEVADRCLKGDLLPSDFVGQVVEGVEVTQEMADYVQQYLDYIWDIHAQYADPILMTEHRVDYSDCAPKGFGTLDCAIIVPSKNIAHIFDLKYGKGVRVEATNNTQAMMYALGLLNENSWLYDIDIFHIHICQPRLNNFSEWDTTTNNLLQWKRNVVIPAVEDALSDNPTYNPSTEACKWCKAKADCPALHKKVTSEIIDMFADEAAVVTDDDKRKILDYKELFGLLVNAVEEDVYHTLSVGGKFSGYKLIAGRATTKWNPDAENNLIGKYGDELYSKKMIGITEARKLLSKDELANNTTKVEGSPKLVQSSAKGEPLIFNLFEKLS